MYMNPAYLKVLDEALEVLRDEAARGTIATSGLMGVAAAVNICDQISLFGLGGPGKSELVSLLLIAL